MLRSRVARQHSAVEYDLRFGREAGADKPEGVVVFEPRGAMEDARPARGAGGEAVALPRVAKAEGVGEEHESGWRLETGGGRSDASGLLVTVL